MSDLEKNTKRRNHDSGEAAMLDSQREKVDAVPHDRGHDRQPDPGPDFLGVPLPPRRPWTFPPFDTV